MGSTRATRRGRRGGTVAVRRTAVVAAALTILAASGTAFAAGSNESGIVGAACPQNTGHDAANPICDFPVPTADSVPFSIVVGRDGALWFTEFDGNKIGVLTP